MSNMSVVVVGLGNPILSDDGVGWHVARMVRDKLWRDGPPAGATVCVVEACVGGLSLAEMLVGYDRAVVVDAVLTEKAPPGTVSRLRLADLPGTLNTASAHDTNLNTALRALRRFGAHLPSDEALDCVTIEVEDVWTFAEGCTSEVEAAIPTAAEMVISLLSHGL